MKLKKRNKLRIINACKGTIALFLAVLMTPFLTIAMLLVETGRYNSAVSILDEAMGVSSTSLLSSYDGYLKERWGLLAVDQGADIDALYTNYMNTNAGILGDSITLNSVNAKGEFALNDPDILHNQIMEYCTLNAPVELVNSFANLSDLVAKLEDLANVGKYFDMIGSSAGAIDSTITLVESATDLKDIADDLDDLKEPYKNNYQAFEDSVKALTTALKTERPTDEAEAEKYDNNITKLRKDVDKKKGEYKKTLDEIAKKLGEYKELMGKCVDSMESIKGEITSAGGTAFELATKRSKKEEELDEVNKRISAMESSGEKSSAPALYTSALDEKTRLEGELAEISVQEGLATATQEGLSSVSDGWKDSFSSYSDDTIGELIKSYEELSTKVDSFSSESVVESTVVDASTYRKLSIAGYISSSDIDDYLETQAKEMESGSLSALIDGVISFFDSLCNLQLFYDSSLSAYINADYYTEKFGGLPGDKKAGGGVLEIITDIKNLMSAAATFSEKLIKLELLEALEQILEFVNSIAELKDDIDEFIKEIGTNIKELFTSNERVYYSTYTTFNLPCRTDKTPGFKTMTGYDLTSESLTAKPKTSSLTIIDDLSILVRQIEAGMKGSGGDYTFSGAELEYVLFGSNSEVANQLYTFAALYIIRLILNIPAVFFNSEVQSLATSSTFGYPIVMILEIFIEPLIDTVLLVNGAAIDIYKTKIYLTPSGIPEVIEKLVSILKLTSAEKESIGKDVKKAFDVAEDDFDYKEKLKKYAGKKPIDLPDIFEFDYRKYCFIILLLTVSEERQMARLSNLIQMETMYYYMNKGASYTFDLRNSYTFVSTETDVSVKQILPSLADSSLFNVKREQHRGY